MTMEVETTGTEVTGGDSATEAVTSTTASAEGEGGLTTEAQAQETPPYTPNLKYKVLDTEKEFDPHFKNIIKDLETEKKIRDLHTRADGIEHIKEDRERLVEKVSTFEAEKQEWDEKLDELRYFVQNDDLQSFFEKLNIPKEQVLRYALREVQFADNPQARQQYEAQRQALHSQRYQQIQGMQEKTQFEQAAINLRERELAFAIRQPETLAYVEAFDSRVGKPGAFVEEVINRGRFHFQAQGIDMPVDKLIQEVAQVYGLSQAQTPQQGQGMQGKGVVQGSKGKPVIPSIPGSGQSAVKKQIKGTAGLKERYNELMARG